MLVIKACHWHSNEKTKSRSILWDKLNTVVLCERGIQYRTVPSKAEDEKGNAKQSRHSVPDQGIGMAGTEVETKPEGSKQGKQLTRQKIHLYGRNERLGCSKIFNETVTFLVLDKNKK